MAEWGSYKRIKWPEKERKGYTLHTKKWPGTLTCSQLCTDSANYMQGPLDLMAFSTCSGVDAETLAYVNFTRIY